MAEDFHESEAYARMLVDAIQRDEQLPASLRLRAALAILNRKPDRWLPSPIRTPDDPADTVDTVDTLDALTERAYRQLLTEFPDEEGFFGPDQPVPVGQSAHNQPAGGAMETVDTVDTMDNTDKIDTVDTVDTKGTTGIVDTTDTVHAADTIDAMNATHMNTTDTKDIDAEGTGKTNRYHGHCGHHGASLSRLVAQTSSDCIRQHLGSDASGIPQISYRELYRELPSAARWPFGPGESNVVSKPAFHG
ncbi:MAG: hypothetical protein LC114_15595 [Bryobacterales bacterium]|nr:hypothetical protein [Bryobacterales bacterium]